ncbi:MAG TPA: TerC/Alx family metal homeostasis membrane protein [Myxococcaceae bacterium]|nr:TerC/Alx family metal homeostasis membrane protein [Myxococcaceae bacterium]
MTALAWAGFNAGVLLVLAIDLGLTGRKGRALTRGEATRWVLLWVTLSLVFCAGLWAFRGAEAGLQFLGGYLVEYALSVDNLFVFLVLFEAFGVRGEHRHRLLFWGVLGAIVLRASLLFAGAALVRRFQWLLVALGALLLWAAIRLLAPGKPGKEVPRENVVVRLARRVLPMAVSPPEGRFTLAVREDGRLRFTPLFLVLLMVETTDLVFAFDSIPAVLGMSRDPFILYTSNVCAVLGLRSLFFVLEALIGRLAYLRPALAAVLAFVGAKMVLEPWVVVPIWLSLAVIGGIFAAAVLASLLRPPPGRSPGPRR